MKTKSIKKFALRILLVISGLYVVLLILIYFFQEKLLFHPQPVPEYFANISPPEGIEEKYIDVGEGVKLHGLLLHAEHSKGLVFYLHGNGGNCFNWAEGLTFMVNQGYDVFVLDYRGYGKSTGSISSEAQLHDDIAKAFYQVSKGYKPDDVIIMGYSIGTGLAAHLAMDKNIKALVLEAPYYSLSRLSSEKVPLLPEFIKKYKINTFEFLPKVKAPVYIFHGTDDALIPYRHAEELKAVAKNITLYPVEGTGHNDINESAVFMEQIEALINR